MNFLNEEEMERLKHLCEKDNNEGLTRQENREYVSLQDDYFMENARIYCGEDVSTRYRESPQKRKQIHEH